ELVNVASYRVGLDLTTADTTFLPTTTVRFRAHPGASTWLDLVVPTVREVVVNGESRDPDAVYDGARVALDDLAQKNEVTVVAEAAYSRTGEGLHRFVDPVDDEVYLYSQFEVADARRVYACFDQPDLKATFQVTVRAPSHWQVVSNAPTPRPSKAEDGVRRWKFATTPRLPTYITALVAGPYHVERSQYEGRDRTVPLGLFC